MPFHAVGRSFLRKLLMIFMKELTNQILLPGFRAVLTVHSQVNGGVYVYILTAFASFLEDSEGEEQDDGFLG